MVPTEQDVEMIVDFFHGMFATLSVQASKLWPASPSAASVRARAINALSQLVTPDARRDGHGGRARASACPGRAALRHSQLILWSTIPSPVRSLKGGGREKSDASTISRSLTR